MAIPAGDLVLLRSAPQTSKLYLVVQQPQYRSGGVWTGYEWSCRINGNPTADPTVALTVDAGTAAVDLLDGMTVLIGSSYGEWDKAVCYVRGDQTVGPATTTLNISTSSEIRGHVVDDDYVVVLDEFRFRQRYGRIEVSGDDVLWYKDYDIEWDDLGANDPARRLAMMPPTPIMGTHGVKFVEIGTASAQFYFDWSESYAVAPGEAITTWTSEGESDHVGGTWNSAAETPGWQTVDAISGLRGFRVTLEVDDGNGNATTLPYRRGVRYVFTLRRPGETQVGDPDNAEPITEFVLEQPLSATFEEGFWRTSIRVFESEASKYVIMPEALVVLFTEDTYTNADGTTYEGSVGPHEDRENILLVGRIVANTIRTDPETGDVLFEVASPGAEAAMYHNYPVVIQNDDAGTSWIDTPDLTVDRAVHYYTTWHTTLKLVADLFQSDDAAEIYAQDFTEGDIYSTLNNFLYERIFARLLCNKYGRFFCEIDAQDNVFGLTTRWWTMQTGDWLDEVAVRENMQTPVNAVECGGLIYAAGAVTPKLSRAPGLFDKYRGSRVESNALAITGQADLNTKCGRHLNGLNWTYEADFLLAGNWRYSDIAPQRVVNVGTLTTDRGTLTGDYIVRAVTNEYDPVVGAIFTSIQTQIEMDDGVTGVTIVIPDTMPDKEYEPTYYTNFAATEIITDALVPGEPPANPGSGSIYVYASSKTDGDHYYTADITATPPVWTQVTPSDWITKTVLMNSEVANRLFGYGDEGFWEYQDLPLGAGTWTQLYTQQELADEFGHAGDFMNVETFRMQFSVRPGQEGWAWAGVNVYWNDGTVHLLVGVLHTRDAWNTVTYATTLYELTDGVNWDWVSACDLYENGLALDMHSNTVYVCTGKAPSQDGLGAPLYDGFWRLYRSQNFGYSFTLAQSATYEWGTDGYEWAGHDDGFCDVWVPWVSDTYAGGAVFWTACMLDTANDSSDIEYETLIYRSLNHGLSRERIGDDGGLDQGLNFIGGPWNSLSRLWGGLSATNGKDADQTKIWTWISGQVWTEFRDTATATWRDFLGWLIVSQSGYTLSSALAYQEPYLVQSGSETDKTCTEKKIFWMTWVY